MNKRQHYSTKTGKMETCSAKTPESCTYSGTPHFDEGDPAGAEYARQRNKENNSLLANGMSHKIPRKEKIETFNEELSLIKNEQIKAMTQEAIARTHDKFFEAQAASSGKYHPQISLGKGGLVRHTKATVHLAKTILVTETSMSDDDKDIVIAASMIHDNCKSGKNWEHDYTVHEHPLLVKELINDNEFKTNEEKEYWNKINHAISSHMGQWNTNNKDSDSEDLPTPNTRVAEIVHLADFLASRKELSLDIFEGYGSYTEQKSVSQKNKDKVDKLLPNFNDKRHLTNALTKFKNDPEYHPEGLSSLKKNDNDIDDMIRYLNN